MKRGYPRLNLINAYSSEKPQHDNFDAIELRRTAHIPMNCKAFVGVPFSFKGTFNPDQFEFIRFGKGDDGKDSSVNDKFQYRRIIIKKTKDCE